MKVMKFGGTSVGSAQRMKNVTELICGPQPNLVVLSAMSGTTNTLVEICGYLYSKNPDSALDVIGRLEKKYRQHVEELYSTEEAKKKALDFLTSTFKYMASFAKQLFTSVEEKIILAQGENEALADEATEELVILNSGLVRTVALRFRDRGLDFEDLIQIGTMGLIKAIRSFDIDRGTLFSTYAVPMIFGEIRRTLRDEGIIKVGRYY
ncbi:MAG: sigma-70 family RNA polymerase sigma factor, partial [Bacteroidales bacterium]|nr:sigma-70 family RNA polymerase sigma factor [Bacteroidales bacterium]